MTIIPVADYRPDAPAYLGTHSTIAFNVIPASDGADRPIYGPQVSSAALSSQVLGAGMAISPDNVFYLAAGTRETLYVKDYTTWVEKSGADYHATIMQPWRFAQFGTRLLATNNVDGLQSWTVGDPGDFAAIAGAPKGAHIATIEPGFVMVGNIYDGADLSNRLHWSALNDATDWPTLGTTDAASKQSDVQDLPIGGAVTAILPAIGGSAGVVLTERAIYRMDYVGAPLVFAFREISRGSGNICPNAAVSVNGVAFFISENGFEKTDGQSVVAIGSGRVSRTFFSQVDRRHLHRVCAAVDVTQKIIVWAYPTLDGTNGNPDKWLIYNYETDKWRAADDASLAVSWMFSLRQPGNSIDSGDGLYTGSVDSLGAYSFDDEAFNGGKIYMGGFDTSYRFVLYIGTRVEARLETGEVDANGDRVFVSGIRPLTDAVSLTAQVGHRTNFGATVTYTTATAPGADAFCPQRISTRYARARINIPAGATWTYLQGADVRLRPEGKR